MTAAHVGCHCEVSPALPYQEPLQVTGPLPSLVLRAEDMCRKHNHCHRSWQGSQSGFPLLTLKCPPLCSVPSTKVLNVGGVRWSGPPSSDADTCSLRGRTRGGPGDAVSSRIAGSGMRRHLGWLSGRGIPVVEVREGAKKRSPEPLLGSFLDVQRYLQNPNSRVVSGIFASFSRAFGQYKIFKKAKRSLSATVAGQT